MESNFTQEKLLERQYQGVLGYADAKDFLKETVYTAAKINGAIKRFCKAEEAVKPRTFIEMENFVSDLFDFWLDANPEQHTDTEPMLRQALSNYIAYAIVWKAKSKSSNILDPTIMATAGKAIQIKNALAHAVKTSFSYAKRNPALNKDELAEGFKIAFCSLAPIVNKIDKGELPLPENETMEDLTRLIGGFLASDKTVLKASQELKQIAYKSD
ncbi:MAG: hypothetical protein U9N77_00465 [Thermodesulfobacteriota bacterium]|nr:hypothetical protein [Thermodesulfobacteriota bacterium]